MKEVFQNGENIQSNTSNYAILRQNYFAGFWRRIVAFFIDFILISLALVVIGIIFGFLYALFLRSIKQLNDKEIRIIGNILGFIISWLYFSIMESSSLQGTIGKLILNIRVTDLYQKRIKFGKATCRYICRFISGIVVGIGFIMAGFTKQKQALHDMLVGTLVIKKETIIKNIN